MASALLEWAERFGGPGAREALIRRFGWVTAAHQLGRPMVMPESGLSIRSQIRKGERDNKIPRMAGSIANSLPGRSTALVDASHLDLRLECRSYELGWTLWSFGRRQDLRALTDQAGFAVRAD